MAQLPALLHQSIDDGHRCHIWLDPSTHVHPPAIFRLRTIKSRWNINDFYDMYLQAYRLLPYSRLTDIVEKFMLDSSLQSALVDRWRPETHIFYLRCGELTSTLKDVSLITGLPISDKPLVPIAFSSNWSDDIRVCLDTEVPNSGARGGRKPRGVPMSWLTELYHQIPDNATKETLRRHLFVYLFFFLV
jgi:hypothetical protein